MNVLAQGPSAVDSPWRLDEFEEQLFVRVGQNCLQTYFVHQLPLSTVMAAFSSKERNNSKARRHM